MLSQQELDPYMYVGSVGVLSMLQFRRDPTPKNRSTKVPRWGLKTK